MLRSKLPEGARTIIKEIVKEAQQHECVDLAASLPEFDMNDSLKKSLIEHIQTGSNQYAPIEGIVELRKAISSYYENISGCKYNPETEITVTAGATEAVWAAITAIIHEDDEVIIIEPSYENYVPAIRINGGTPIFVPLKHPDYHIDWNDVIRMINQRTKMIILNSPHIPSGTVFSEDDFKNLQKIVVGNKITVLCDETYGTYTYGKPFVSISKFPALAKQSIVISSLSKSLNMSGWKTGYCIAPADITKEIRRMHNYICNGSNAVIQYAMADIINGDVWEKNRECLKAKRDLLCSLLKGTKYKLVPTESSWFQLVDFSEITEDSGKDFCLNLVKKFGVLVYPMSAYYHDKSKSKVIRICFARSDEKIRAGVEKLIEASANY